MPKPRKPQRGKGQSPIEVIAIAIVLVGLLLLVLITTYVRNMETLDILSMSENSLQCSSMSAVIARLYSNRAETEVSMQLAKAATLQRVQGKPGGITVGDVSCSYIGSVEMLSGEKDTDSDGISFSDGEWCLAKNDGAITASEGECS